MSTRDRILDAAAEVIQTLGLARATTKEIARAAGFSEATLYKHFADKQELFLFVLAERLPGFTTLIAGFTRRAGQGTLAGNLEAIARTAIDFYQRSIPMAASVFAQPALLDAQRAANRRHGMGPQLPNQALAAYLRAEQQLGRVGETVEVDAAAALLLGACFQHAFLHRLNDQPPQGWSAAQAAAAFAGPLAATLTPPPG